VYSDTGQWGTFYDARRDLVRVQAKTERLSKFVEQLTILIDKQAERGALLKIQWENTGVSFPLLVKR
jgi:DUF2911 family protein